MARILSFLSWNVEHFHNDPTRVARVVSAIAAKAPDVFAIYEVKGSAAVNGMRRLPKTHAETWWNGKDNWAPSSLDHVFAADHLNFRSFAGGAEIEVSGWVEETTPAAKKDWIENFSDHAMLYGKIVD